MIMHCIVPCHDSQIAYSLQKISGYLNSYVTIKNINYLLLLMFCMHVYVCVYGSL